MLSSYLSQAGKKGGKVSELQSKIWWIIPVASPTSESELSTPSMGLWLYVAFSSPISLWASGLWVVAVHTHVLTGQWEQRGGLLVSVALVYLLMRPSRTQKPWASNDLGLCPSEAIVILNSRASNWPSYRPVKNGRASFAPRLDNMSKGGLAIWLLYYRPSSETCLT